jgi:glycosyltransferase involved in cell wall biosynthesis
MAMYSKQLDKWSYYADPSKTKTYLAAGLPIITTSLTHIASELERRKCAKVVEYNKKETANAIIELLSNETELKNYRKNAMTFAKQFDWNTLLDTALSSHI